VTAPRLVDVWTDPEPAGAGDADCCDLMGELSTLMVGVAAALALVQRRLLVTDPMREELSRVDQELSTPIALARQLALALHARRVP
jgi:hypothetical protein